MKFKDFAEVWIYNAYWDRFADTASPAGVFQVIPPETVGRSENYWGSRVTSRFWPFYAVEEDVPYFMYFDKRALPVKIW